MAARTIKKDTEHVSRDPGNDRTLLSWAEYADRIEATLRRGTKDDLMLGRDMLNAAKLVRGDRAKAGNGKSAFVRMAGELKKRDLPAADSTLRDAATFAEIFDAVGGGKYPRLLKEHYLTVRTLDETEWAARLSEADRNSWTAARLAAEIQEKSKPAPPWIEQARAAFGEAESAIERVWTIRGGKPLDAKSVALVETYAVFVHARLNPPPKPVEVK